MQTCNKPGATKTIIAAMMLTLMYGVAMAAGQSDAFSQLDTNKDNYVDAKEASASVQLTQMFAAADTNKDGKLSVAEFEKLLNAPAS